MKHWFAIIVAFLFFGNCLQKWGITYRKFIKAGTPNNVFKLYCNSAQFLDIEESTRFAADVDFLKGLKISKV